MGWNHQPEEGEIRILENSFVKKKHQNPPKEALKLQGC